MNSVSITKKIDDKIIIITLFILSILFRFHIADFNKTLTVYPDELIYTGLAKSLSAGAGFYIHNAPYYFQNCLYSFLLIPAYLFKDANIRLTLITLLNCTLISSSIFPTYMIAKEISSDKRVWFLSSVIVITLPDLAMSITFMSENLFYPLLLWCIYFMLKSISNIGAIRWTVLSSIFAYLCYFAKAVALYLVLTYIAMLFLSFVYNWNINKKFPNNYIQYIKQFIIYITLFAIPYVGMMRILFSAKGGSYAGAVSNSTSALSNLHLLIKMFLENVIYCNLAMFFLPILIFFLFRGTLNKKSRILFYTSVIAILGALAVLTVLISVYDSTELFRPHMRYYSALFVPILIIAFDQMLNAQIFANTLKKANILYSICLFIFILISIKCIGTIQYGCTADQSLLRYYNKIPALLANYSFNIEYVYKFFFIFMFIIMLISISLLKKYSIIPIIALLLCFNITNNKILNTTYLQEYTSEYSQEKFDDIAKINNWLQSISSDNNVLIITDTYGDANSRMLDVYLTENAYFTTVDAILSNNVDNVFTITPNSLPVALIHQIYSIDKVDYIIDATNSIDFADVADLEITTDGQLQVLKNKNTSNICFTIPTP